MENQIKEGDTVIFDDVFGERQSIITLRGKARVKLGKAYYSADPIIGCPYGTLFTLSSDGKSLERTHHSPSDEWNADVEVTRNNSKLLDANETNQALKQDDILAMKQAGKGGKEIIDALTNNSVTFQTKSEFAQEKYKKRKAKKYVQLACAKHPTTASICDALFNKQPSRIGYLRPDALGILLHMANVGPGSKVLVFENCGGMITGAVAERMGGFGTVCSTYLEAHPKGIEIVKSFNFSSETMKTITRAPLLNLLKTRREQLLLQNGSGKEDEERTEKMKKSDGFENGGGSKREEEAEEGTGDVPMDPSSVTETIATTTTSAVEEKQAPTTATTDGAQGAASVANNNSSPPFSGCILCSPILHPKTALRALFPLLTPSASFAVWSQNLQPLTEAMNDLRSSGTAVNLMVQETWYRKQQVLPKRTHPTMAMNHGGGYLLSGIVTLVGTKLPMVALPPTKPPSTGGD